MCELVEARARAAVRLTAGAEGQKLHLCSLMTQRGRDSDQIAVAASVKVYISWDEEASQGRLGPTHRAVQRAAKKPRQ